MTILIRDARSSEYAAIGELLGDTYAEFVPADYVGVLTDVATRAGLPATDVLAAIDLSDGSLVGTVTFVRPGSELLDALRPGVDSASSSHAGMRMMAVDKPARGRGVGRTLVGECIARARLAGFAEMAFVTSAEMAVAQHLYRSLGFIRAPDRDKPISSGELLPAFVRTLDPWPMVREATPDEYAAAGALTAEAYVTDGFVSDDDDYAGKLRDATERAAQAVLLVAVDRDTPDVVGTVTMCPPGSPYREIGQPHEAEFRMLAVSSHARGNGVGEALVRSVVARAQADGMRGIAMSSLDEMRAAHRLYERLGFVRDPTRDWGVEDVRLWAFSREL